MCLRETQVLFGKKIWILFDRDCTPKLTTLWYKNFAAEFSKKNLLHINNLFNSSLSGPLSPSSFYEIQNLSYMACTCAGALVWCLLMWKCTGLVPPRVELSCHRHSLSCHRHSLSQTLLVLSQTLLGLSQTLLGNPHRHVSTNHGQTDRHRQRQTNRDRQTETDKRDRQRERPWQTITKQQWRQCVYPKGRRTERERDPDNPREDCLVESTYTLSTHKQVEREREWDLDKPRRNSLIDKRRIRAPAKGVTMFDRPWFHQLAIRLQLGQNVLVWSRVPISRVTNMWRRHVICLNDSRHRGRAAAEGLFIKICFVELRVGSTRFADPAFPECFGGVKRAISMFWHSLNIEFYLNIELSRLN